MHQNQILDGLLKVLIDHQSNQKYFTKLMRMILQRLVGGGGCAGGRGGVSRGVSGGGQFCISPPPTPGYAKIRSIDGQYASYWNAFVLLGMWLVGLTGLEPDRFCQ